MNSFIRQTPIPADQMHSFLKDKQAWENAIAMYQGPDPLDHWYNYVCWYENHGHGDPENKFRATLERCLTLFEHNEYYKQDPRMIRLWLKYIDVQQNPLHYYQALYQRGVGRSLAVFYVSWANHYESIQSFKEAESIFNLGFQEKAQPYVELHHAYNKFVYTRNATAAALALQQQQQQQQQQMQVQVQQQQQQQQLKATSLSSSSLHHQYAAASATATATTTTTLHHQQHGQQLHHQVSQTQSYRQAQHQHHVSTAVTATYSVAQSVAQTHLQQHQTTQPQPPTQPQPQQQQQQPQHLYHQQQQSQQQQQPHVSYQSPQTQHTLSAHALHAHTNHHQHSPQAPNSSTSVTSHHHTQHSHHHAHVQTVLHQQQQQQQQSQQPHLHHNHQQPQPQQHQLQHNHHTPQPTPSSLSLPPQQQQLARSNPQLDHQLAAATPSTPSSTQSQSQPQPQSHHQQQQQHLPQQHSLHQHPQQQQQPQQSQQHLHHPLHQQSLPQPQQQQQQLQTQTPLTGQTLNHHHNQHHHHNNNNNNNNSNNSLHHTPNPNHLQTQTQHATTEVDAAVPTSVSHYDLHQQQQQQQQQQQSHVNGGTATSEALYQAQYQQLQQQQQRQQQQQQQLQHLQQQQQQQTQSQVQQQQQQQQYERVSNSTASVVGEGEEVKAVVRAANTAVTTTNDDSANGRVAPPPPPPPSDSGSGGSNDTSIQGVRLPRRFAAYCRNNYETWQPALFLEEPADPSRQCHYIKNLVYPGDGCEYSPEELRLARFAKRIEAQQRQEAEQQQQQQIQQEQQQQQQQQDVQLQEVVTADDSDDDDDDDDDALSHEPPFEGFYQHEQQQQLHHQQYTLNGAHHYHQLYKAEQAKNGNADYEADDDDAVEQDDEADEEEDNDDDDDDGDEEEDEDEEEDADDGEDDDDDDSDNEKLSMLQQQQQMLHQQQQQQQQQLQHRQQYSEDVEDQIEASTIRLSQNKTLKIKFRKNRSQLGDSFNGGSSNYSASYTIENVYQNEVASPPFSEEQVSRRNGHSFHPYIMGQTSTPKTTIKRGKAKLKRASKFQTITCSSSNSSSTENAAVPTANTLTAIDRLHHGTATESSTARAANTQNGGLANGGATGGGGGGDHHHHHHHHQQIIQNANYNDNANYSFLSAATLENSNCSISSAVDRLNFRDATVLANHTGTGANINNNNNNNTLTTSNNNNNVADFSTYQENSYFATQHDTEAKERRLQKALETIERHLTKHAIDPFNSELCRAFLTKLDFPGTEEATHANYKIIQTPIPKISNSRALTLPDGLHFNIDKEVGRGSYGSVYKATDVNSSAVVALKFQKPPNTWEIYICDQVLKRIKSPNVLPGLMDVSTAIIAPNASLIATEFSPFGSLLDINNKIRQATSKVMHESLVMHFAAQICLIIHHLHRQHIIHADIKPDNFLLMRIPSTDLHYPSLRLIDFGCAIDMSLFPQPEKTKFRKVIQTDGFTCVEMQEGRPWSYETDLFCIAGTVHVMLMGEYMQLQKRAGTWDIKQKLPRYLKKHVWTRFFGGMLNIRSDSKLPDLRELCDVFKEESAKMDSELQKQIRTLSNILYRR